MDSLFHLSLCRYRHLIRCLCLRRLHSSSSSSTLIFYFNLQRQLFWHPHHPCYHPLRYHCRHVFFFVVIIHVGFLLWISLFFFSFYVFLCFSYLCFFVVVKFLIRLCNHFFFLLVSTTTTYASSRYIYFFSNQIY